MENKNKPPGRKEFLRTSTRRQWTSNAAGRVPRFEFAARWNHYKHINTSSARGEEDHARTVLPGGRPVQEWGVRELRRKGIDLDVSNIGLGAEAERQADHLVRFSYTGRSGEEVPLYLVPVQVAGIVVEQCYSGGS